MASLYKMDKGTELEFFRVLNAAGFTAEDAKKLSKSPEDAAAMIAFMRSRPSFRLIHGVFNPTADVLESFKVRCAEKNIDFGRFTWEDSEEAPDFDPNDPETVVVLEVCLGTLQESFEFAWEWIKDGQGANWRWDGMISSPDKLRLLSGSEDFKPHTLRWRRIKLDTNVGKKPIDVRDPDASPGLPLLYVAAQHPERPKAIDYKKRFGWFVPGLECTAFDDVSWQHVPCIYLNHGDRRVGLDANWCDGSSDYLAVPVFRE